MSIYFKITYLLVLFISSNAYAFFSTHTTKKVEEAFLNNDLATATEHVTKMRQEASSKWLQYYGALKTLKFYTSFQKEKSKFNANTSTPRFYHLRDSYNKYINSFDKDFKAQKFRKSFVKHMNAQAKSVTEQMHILVATHDAFLDEMKRFEKIKIKVEKRRLQRAQQLDQEEKLALAADRRARQAEENDRVRKQKIADKKRIEKSLALDKKKNEQKIKLNKKVIALNELAKEQGYSGYVNTNVVRIIYETQNEGGLGKYIGKVIGCHSYNREQCVRGYSFLRAVQILDNGVLYAFSEYSGNRNFSFMVYSSKEQERIYQEGQVFENAFHVFDGMFSYKTVLGVQKSVPIFEKVKLLK